MDNISNVTTKRILACWSIWNIFVSGDVPKRSFSPSDEKVSSLGFQLWLLRVCIVICNHTKIQNCGFPRNKVFKRYYVFGCGLLVWWTGGWWKVREDWWLHIKWTWLRQLRERWGIHYLYCSGIRDHFTSVTLFYVPKSHIHTNIQHTKYKII